jgi:5-methylcytosine-specific restriction protein A
VPGASRFGLFLCTQDARLAIVTGRHYLKRQPSRQCKLAESYFIRSTMPLKPRVPCSHFGCAALVEPRSGPCEKHRATAHKADVARRGDARGERGYGFRWMKLRKMFLNSSPICACGCGQGAQVVDHIIPVNGADDPKFYEWDNLQSLTIECHNRKTQEDKKKGLTK